MFVKVLLQILYVLEVNILRMNYQNFVAKVYAELKLRRMTRKDLAKLTGYSENTINVFMSNTDSRDRSDNVAKAISAALHIEL